MLTKMKIEYALLGEINSTPTPAVSSILDQSNIKIYGFRLIYYSVILNKIWSQSREKDDRLRNWPILGP